MKLAWLTDIHLNFLDEDERIKFYQKIIRKKTDAVIISGDIAEGSSVCDLLIEMVNVLKRPIYFVLGNHDYYCSSVNEVTKDIEKLTKNNNQLYWLKTSGILALNENTILLGQDGWADGRLGDYQNSRVELNDSRLIGELFQQRILGRNQLLQKMQSLADIDAKNLKADLISAVSHNPKKIIVVTHIPPFKEVSMHKGKISDNDWLPFFSSKASGDVLIDISQKNPAIEFLVLCGHTHSKSIYQPLGNMIIKAGSAQYYRPTVQEVIEV
jgi:predicted MPP superfamily phosphohydrolase